MTVSPILIGPPPVGGGGVVVAIVAAGANDGLDPIFPERALQHADHRLAVETVEDAVDVERHQSGRVTSAAEGFRDRAQGLPIVRRHHDIAARASEVDIGAAEDAIIVVDGTG